MNNHIVYKNIFFSIALQIFTMISGFIVPRVILVFFGSNINGLISSINQFLTYGSLLEGGVGTVIAASLYKPLREGNQEKVSAIFNATKRFFYQMGVIYSLYSLIVVFVFTFLVNTGNSKWFVAMLVIVLSFQSIIQYLLSMSYRILLEADRKVYYVSLTQILIVVANVVLIIIITNTTKNIILVKLGSSLVYLIQPLMYVRYVEKTYKINRTILPDKGALSQRWDGFAQQIAYFASSNTDILLITFFSSLKMVSVYSIYSMITMAISNLVVAISSSIVPSMGRVLSENDTKKIKNKFERYEFLIVIISSILYSSVIIVLTPFVMLYTKGIHDANYSQLSFGIILALGKLFYCFSEPYVRTILAAGHIKQVSRFAYIESGINIIISLILVLKLGIMAVALGTLLSFIYRFVAYREYLGKKIIDKIDRIFSKKVILLGIINIIFSVVIAVYIHLEFDSYISFILQGVGVFIVVLLFDILLGNIVFRKRFRQLFKK